MTTRREWLVSTLAAAGALACQSRFAAALAVGRRGSEEPEMNTEERVLAMERTAMERWAKGDPDGFLAICAPDISYFDPFVEREVDGVEALTAYYNGFRGQVHIDRFDFVEPRVQIYGDLAILTFKFVSQGGNGQMRWNTTEVYRRTGGAWQIVHSHWAFHQPKLAAKPA